MVQPSLELHRPVADIQPVPVAWGVTGLLYPGVLWKDEWHNPLHLEKPHSPLCTFAEGGDQLALAAQPALTTTGVHLGASRGPFRAFSFPLQLALSPCVLWLLRSHCIL